MPAMKKNPAPKTPAPGKRKPRTAEQEEAAKSLEKKTSRMALLAAIGDAEPPVKTVQPSGAQPASPGEPKKEGPEEHPGVQPKEEPAAPVLPPTPPTTALSKPKQLVEDAARTEGLAHEQQAQDQHVVEEMRQDAVLETAIQAVRDNQTPAGLDKGCDPDMINALQIDEDKLAAITGASGGVAQELPRSALDLQIASQTLSAIHQPATPQASVADDKRHEKTPGEHLVEIAEHHMMPEPEPTE